MHRTISLFEASGVISQSVCGVNLAISLATQDKERTALIDLDLSGGNEIDSLLNFKPSKSLTDIIPLVNKLDENLVKGYLSFHNSGISVLGGIDRTQITDINSYHLQKTIELISKVHPHTIVITSNNTDDNLASIFDCSDIIFLTVSPHLLSLNHAKMFLETLKGWHFSVNMVKVVVINNSNIKECFSKKQIEDYLGVEIFAELPNDEQTIVSSINDGIPAVVLAPHSDFSRAIKNLSQKLLQDGVFVEIDKSERELAKKGELEPKTKIENGEKQEQHDDQSNSGWYFELKEKLHEKLIDALNLQNIDLKGSSDVNKFEHIREATKKIIEDLISTETTELSRQQCTKFIDELLSEVLGLGCLEEYLKDSDVTEIMVNGPNDIYIEKKGKIHLTNSHFRSAAQLRTVIDRIVSPIGRRIDESSPLVDARLADGSRVNIVIPPLSLVGSSITIRKFAEKKLVPEDIVRFDSISSAMVEFLRICVLLRKNIVISGGTGSGKTTLLNVVSSFIPSDERIVTIEDSAELKLPQKHVVRLESRPASIEGTGEITIRRLVINALRMRPDRIVVGECRGGEALDMLQAMNTGHDGSLTTVHANSPKDAVSRLSTLVIMAGTELPEKAIKEQISSAIQIIVQLSRLSDGSRKIIEISEVTSTKSDNIELMPIFKFEQTGIKDGKVDGKFLAMGYVPSFIDDVERHGLVIDKGIFRKGEL